MDAPIASGSRRPLKRQRQRPVPRRMAGLAFLWLLMTLVLIGIGIGRLTDLHVMAKRHEQEAQLLITGHMYRAAIRSYYEMDNQHRYPPNLQALLKDPRTPYTRRHLRRLYPDPITGSTDWGLLRAEDGGVMGVYSKAPGAPLKQGDFDMEDDGFEGAGSYVGWRFVFEPQKSKPGDELPTTGTLG